MSTILKPSDKKPMSRGRLATVLIAALVGWVGIIGAGFHFLFGYHPPADHVGPVVHAEETDFAAGSLGKERRDLLIAATRRYVQSHPNAAASMREGKELAPAEFLNEQLGQAHEKFRVRSVKGMIADIYDVT